MPQMRYEGVFSLEPDTATYGFIVNITSGSGKGSPPPEKVFLSGTMGSQALGEGRPLRALDGMRVSFDIRESFTHPGKKEAYNVSLVEHVSVPS